MMKKYLSRPKWIKSQILINNKFNQLDRNINNYNIRTVCESSCCPNMGKCWSNGVATIMILGNICTRNCKFCSILSGKPSIIDKNEPIRVSKFIKKMGLEYVVITSVSRDDLIDRGSSHWAKTIKSIRKNNKNIIIETLIPDFGGIKDFFDNLLETKPNVVNHNIETVERLQRKIRKVANYQTSLNLLEYSKKKCGITKSGIMLGLGEKKEEVLKTMMDLRAKGVDILTIGQYLQPNKKSEKVHKWIKINEFKKLRHEGLSMGFKVVLSAPLVRSSYLSKKCYLLCLEKYSNLPKNKNLKKNFFGKQK
jgi:lipoic acid synthetase